MSCTAHVFSCLSLALCAPPSFYLDYASISYYGFGSTVAYYYYLLPGLSLLDARVMTRRSSAWLARGLHGPHRSPPRSCCPWPSCWRWPALWPAARAAPTGALTRSRTFVSSRRWRRPPPDGCRELVFDLRGRTSTPSALLPPLLLAGGGRQREQDPERIQPGLFDIIGHSHQLFHIAFPLDDLSGTTWRRVGASFSRSHLTRPPSWAPWATCCCWVVCLGWSSRSSSAMSTLQ